MESEYQLDVAEIRAICAEMAPQLSTSVYRRALAIPITDPKSNKVEPLLIGASPEWELYFGPPTNTEITQSFIDMGFPQEDLIRWREEIAGVATIHDQRDDTITPSCHDFIVIASHANEIAEAWDLKTWITDSPQQGKRVFLIDLIPIPEPGLVLMENALLRDRVRAVEEDAQYWRLKAERSKQFLDSKEAVDTILRHEMGNAMSVINNSAHLVQRYSERGNYDKAQAEQGRIKSATRILSWMSDLLVRSANIHAELDNTDQTDLPISMELLSLRELRIPFETVAQLLSQSAENQGKEVNVNVDLDLPSGVQIVTDPVYLIVLLNTLGMNAFKHAPIVIEGQVQPLMINIEAYYDNTSHDLQPTFEIIITDNGKGMDLETQELMLVPGFSTDRNSSGLGMNLAQEIVKNLGGVLVPVSNAFTGDLAKTTGTIIHISLPAQPSFYR